MITESDWLELSDEGEYVHITLQDATVHITRFGASDWQIDAEGDNWAGQPGTVDSKQEAIAYVLDKADIIENSGVSPRQVVIT